MNDELKSVLAECSRLERAYYNQEGFRLAPPPAPFKRAAILCRKQKDAQAERSVCERWIAISDDYSSQARVKRREAANVAAGPVDRHIRERLRKLTS